MLILDVKGNYFNQVRKFAYKYNRLDDVIVIELGGKYKYNPLNKPNLKAREKRLRNCSVAVFFTLAFTPEGRGAYYSIIC